MRLAISLLLLLAGTISPAAARAHATLLEAAPRVGSTVAAAPTELRLRFSEAIEAAFSQVTLSSQDGRALPLGQLTGAADDARTVVLAVSDVLSPGVYRVRWRVVSRDTHTTIGDFTFRVVPLSAPGQ